MAKKQRQLPPRRKRMMRLQAASQCLERFAGERPVRIYARWLGVDLECAVKELQLLGVALDAHYLQALRDSLEGQRRAKAAAAEPESIREIGYPGDERFECIAGRTAAGFAFGAT